MLNNTATVTLLGLALYFLVMIWVGVTQGRKQDHAGFVIGGRDVGYIPTIGSLAAGFRDGMGIVFWLGIAFSIGWGGLWFFIGFLFGFGIVGIIGPRVRQLARDRDYVTVGEMLRDSIGRKTEIYTAALICAFIVLYMAVQLFVAGNLFATLLEQPAWIGIVSVAVIVGFYLFAGGYGAVVKTDTIQFFLIFGLIAVPFLMTLKGSGYTDLSSFGTLPKTDKIAFVLLGFGFPVSMGDVWQRVFSARSAGVARYSFFAAIPALAVMTLSLILIGFGARNAFSDVTADNVLFTLFQSDVLPTWALAYIGVVVTAICMSTLDTQAYLLTSTILKNFFPSEFSNQRKHYIKVSQVILIVSLLIMSVVALTISDAIQFLWDTSSLIFILGPIFFFTGVGLYRGSALLDKGMVAILVGATAVYIYLFTQGYYSQSLIWTMAPAAITLIGGLVLIPLGRKQS